jgi:hypothetical protein
MAQDYDKIFREVLKDIFPAVAQKVLGIPPGAYKSLPVDLQYTSEREADQVWEIHLSKDRLSYFIVSSKRAMTVRCSRAC